MNTCLYCHVGCCYFFAQSTLDDMDMEDDMKTLVSDEIKRFRQSYQVCVCVCVIDASTNTPVCLVGKCVCVL